MTELKAMTVIDAYQLEYNDDDLVYLKSDVDKVLAEKDAENHRLNNALDKERSETIKYMDELCNAKNEIERLTIDKRNNELRADVADATVEKLKAEIAELKQKLEDVQASMYADVVDANMENRKLKRSLWLAWAKAAEYKADSINGKTVVGLMTNPKEIRKRRQSKLFEAKADKFREE